MRLGQYFIRAKALAAGPEKREKECICQADFENDCTIRSNADKNIFIGCDRGGTYHDRVNAQDGSKRRLTTTRRISYPFRLYSKKIKGAKWELKIRNPSHNHSADNSMTCHPAARRLTEEQFQKTLHQSEVGSSPRDILSLIKVE